MLEKRYEQFGMVFDESTIKIPPALRINNLRIKPSILVARLEKKGVKLTKIPFLPNGYWYKAPFSLGATPEYLQGYYYLQEAASQVPALVLDPKPSDIVLDMAAAPGSKTTQIAELMGDKGVIIALDTNHQRIVALKNNLERLNLKSVLTYCLDARQCNQLRQTFSKILLDAPCGGNFCVEKNYYQKRSLRDLANRSSLQLSLLDAAHEVLAKGGTLVYSTCSLEPEENEMVIDAFIKKHPDMHLVTTGLTVGDSGLTDVFEHHLDPSLAMTRRFWPHKMNTQGFFVAKVVKA